MGLSNQVILVSETEKKILLRRASGRAGSRGQDAGRKESASTPLPLPPLSGSVVAFVAMARWLSAAPDFLVSSQEHQEGKKDFSFYTMTCD